MLQKLIKYCTAVFLLLFVWSRSYGQDSSRLIALQQDKQMEEKYLNMVDSKTQTFNKSVEKYTTATLGQLMNQEKKMQSKVAKADSASAKKLFSYAIDSLKKFQNAFTNRATKISAAANKYLSGGYIPYLDTLKGSLAFLNKTGNAVGSLSTMQNRLQSSQQSIAALETKLALVEKFNQYLRQRQLVLQGQISRFPFLSKNLQNLKKQAYYYKAQINQYKSMLQDPRKIEQLTIATLEKTSMFKTFMQKNSELSKIFGSALPSANPGNDSALFRGIPSRAAIQKLIQGKIGGASGGNPGALMQQQIGKAQTYLDQLKNKIDQLSGGVSGSAQGFTPNSQKTQSFTKRLEFGANIQFENSNYILPAACDLALQIGYKLNDKASLGLGASYKLGIGNGWNNIQFSSQGEGLRSYLKWKMKGNFDLQGGAEWNYVNQINNIRQLEVFSAWQKSALLGISKNYKISKKLNGDMQFLYDFLWREHKPNTQPIVFRVGYHF
ncbi:MAG TPA: hypothetical protein VK772_07600 [Puia sp.]|jgi:hypothetical protein|nr:hypothetical protein [Puia sp.]